ncbi:MAG: hypothetical protein HQK53_05685, partial [Oligoflexia bacterium]|nr:hypothetical protein [Oligoflexia bacterium]
MNTVIPEKSTNDLDYRTFLSKIAEFGKGVLTITMLASDSERHKLKMFIYRNPNLFAEVKGTHGDIKTIVLTSEGITKFAKGLP